tara:strand:- start:1383 stop:1502 length:120 start_codon:yes stop_codon:yes gene_type:complete
MEILIIFLLVVFFGVYLLRPISKQEKDAFENKSNWRGGF